MPFRFFQFARVREVVLLLLLADPLRAAELTSALRPHDPSTLIGCGDTYWCFHTVPGCRSSFSTNLWHWQEGPRVFARLPA